ncbi:MAG TPA: hypothetical protein VNS63_18055 [Blastocatellia bacterium]|nr:hypothetical protein [Blastocatellia bacterium]
MSSAGSAAVPAAVLSSVLGARPSRPPPYLREMMKTFAPSLFLIVFALTLSGSCSHRYSPPAQNASTPGNSRSPASPSTRSEASGVGFASRTKLVEHYEKHGGEFGSVTIEQYLRMAQELRDRPADDSVLEAVRGDGVVTRFDRKNGAFLAFNRDRIIRTFFKPNDGESYFRRQLNRRD